MFAKVLLPASSAFLPSHVPQLPMRCCPDTLACQVAPMPKLASMMDHAPIVLVMGTAGNSNAWLPAVNQFRAFDPGRPLITPDNIGTGQSVLTSEEVVDRITVASMADDLKTMLKGAGFSKQKRVIAVGWSLGAPIAAQLAASSDLVGGLVLSHAPFGLGRDMKAAIEELSNHLESEEADWSSYNRLLVKFAFPSGFYEDKKFMEKWIAGARAEPHPTSTAVIKRHLQLDLKLGPVMTTALADLQAKSRDLPVAVYYAETDGLTDPEVTRETCTRFRDAGFDPTCRMFSKADGLGANSHMTPVIAPQVFAEELRHFVSEVAPQLDQGYKPTARL